MSDRRVIRVVAACILRGGRVLLDRRRKGSHLADTWEFPGGKVEPGETDQVALARELEEELGVVTEIAESPIAEVTHAYEEFDVNLLLYVAHIRDGEPRAIDVAEIDWFPPSQLKTLPMPPADGPLVDAVLARI